MDEQTVSVTNDEAGSRYVATLDGEEAGFAAYRVGNDVVTFTHTEVDQDTGRKGLGSTLVKAALDDVRAQGGSVVPRCSFVRGWIEKHEEYGDLVASPSR